MEALFRGLLRLYPAAYRDIFAQEMLVVFRQARMEAWGKGTAARAGFYAHELAGVLRGVAEEQWRAAGLPLFAPGRSSMRSGFRYPKNTIVLMAVTFAVTVVAIERARQLSASLPAGGGPHVPPIAPLLPSFPQTLAVLFAITYALAVIVWAVVHALHRSGEYRLHDAETWTQPR